MPPAQHPLPSFKLALRPDHYKITLPNLSYPSRPNAHVPWSGSSAPLLFAKTARPEATIAISTQVPTTTNIYIDTCLVPNAFHEISMLVWQNLKMIVQKLKMIQQRLHGVRTTSPSVTTSV